MTRVASRREWVRHEIVHAVAADGRTHRALTNADLRLQRIQVSRAKHGSLHRHAGFSKRLARPVPFYE